jgi:hypothetical protein
MPLLSGLFLLKKETKPFFCLDTKETKNQGPIFLALIFTTAHGHRNPSREPKKARLLRIASITQG